MDRCTSFRSYLDALDKIGELRIVDRQVDPILEVGAIIRRSYETFSPAPLFTNVADCPPGFRILGAPVGLSTNPEQRLARLAVSLGLPADTMPLKILDALIAARSSDPIKPRIVSSGPCKENRMVGADLDLTRFPSPLIHQGDGGRYFNTWGTVIVRTPDGSWTNWSVARVMALDSTRLTGTVFPSQHLGMIHRMWQDRGEPMPFAIAQGCEPAIPVLSGMAFPAGVDEADHVGGYFGEPAEVVRCETVDLEVPATAEIVVEGFVDPVETAAEGPMGEYAGYLGSVSAPQPVYQVTAVTYRDDPILPVVAGGEPADENHTITGIGVAAEAMVALREAGIPVTAAWMPVESACHWLVVTVPVDARKRLGVAEEELVRRIGEAIFSTKVGICVPQILVMHDDIDPTNTAETVWAFATRWRPASGDVFFPDQPAVPLIGSLDDADRSRCRMTKVVHNCLFGQPMDVLPQRSSFAAAYPEEIRRRVLDMW